MAVLAPSSEGEVVDIVRAALSDARPIELRGGGTKALTGGPREADIVDMRGLSGVVDYEPSELVITLRAGTPLREVLDLVASKDQMLAFEPFDPASLFGGEEAATIGGVVAAGISGSGRLSAGSVRDHLLGFAAVSGRGERFVAGAKVVKNVTGYDLPKLMAGSWGRLGAMTELTLKALPRPRASAVRIIRGQSLEQAGATMAAALGSQAAIGAACYVGSEPGGPATILRLDGVEPSIRARLAILDGFAAGDDVWGSDDWAILPRVQAIAGDTARSLWRISLPSRTWPGLYAALEGQGDRLVDWGGSLMWFASAMDAGALREVVAAAGGHAMLFRPSDRDRTVPTFHPQVAALAALEDRVRLAFDPMNIFNTGRF